MGVKKVGFKSTETSRFVSDRNPNELDDGSRSSSRTAATGLVTTNGATNDLAGAGTAFTSELKVGDIISLQTDTGIDIEAEIEAITTDTAATLTSIPAAATGVQMEVYSSSFAKDEVAVGDTWVNTTSGSVFVCTSNMPAQAVWVLSSAVPTVVALDMTTPVPMPGFGGGFIQFDLSNVQVGGEIELPDVDSFPAGSKILINNALGGNDVDVVTLNIVGSGSATVADTAASLFECLGGNSFIVTPL